MSHSLIVYKHRTNRFLVSLGYDVSLDTITGEIKTESGDDIADWVVSYVTDGTDGKIYITLDDSVTSTIEYTRGLTDLKRVKAGEPLPVFASPIEVEFREVITE